MPKRVVGGDYLLDLSSIEIEKTEDGTKTNITDANVLEQLTNLKKYVSNPNGIKPVWVKMKNGENNELVVAHGTFANVGTGEFEICVQLNGYKLIISIEFTQALNDNNDTIDDWYIDSGDAKYLFLSDAQSVGVAISGNDVPNAKPIYCHPVRLYKDSGDTRYAITMLIFNNTATAFTLATLKQWMIDITDLMNTNLIIMTSGYVKTSTDEITSLSNMYMLTTSHNVGFNGGKYNTLGVQNISITWDSFFEDATLSDGVNKIN